MKRFSQVSDIDRSSNESSRNGRFLRSRSVSSDCFPQLRTHDPSFDVVSPANLKPCQLDPRTVIAQWRAYSTRVGCMSASPYLHP